MPEQQVITGAELFARMARRNECAALILLTQDYLNTGKDMSTEEKEAREGFIGIAFCTLYVNTLKEVLAAPVVKDPNALN